MRAKLVNEALNACSGCEISILDMGEKFLGMLDVIEILHFPILMDRKSFSKENENKFQELPHADLGILSGGIRNADHLETAIEVRKKCDVLIAFGTCATHGGIPALSNSFTNLEILSRYYSTETTDKTDSFPEDALPPLLERCFALDEHIKIDVYLPGCPPHPDNIYAALISIVNGEKPLMPEKSVCDACPVIKKGKVDAKAIRRFVTSPECGSVNEPLDKMRCFFEQGFICMGPVTRAGCGGENIIPRCIAARVPCQGCQGPVSLKGNQRLDMLNAIASHGINISALPSSEYLLEFSGAHNLLRPKKKHMRK